MFMRNSVLILLMLTLLCLVASCRKKEQLYSGYIDGDYVYISAYEAGVIDDIYVKKGESVKAEQKLFKLDGESSAAKLKTLENIQSAIDAYAVDLNKPERIEKIEAFENLEAAVSCLHDGIGIGYRMNKSLARDNAVPQRDYWITDHLHVASGKLDDALLNWISYLKLSSGRPDIVNSVNLLKKAVNEQVVYYKWLEEQALQKSPYNAAVYDVLYRKGEYCQPGKPIVVLLPPENIKARFYVDGNSLNKFKTGDFVFVSLEGVKKTLKARITYISNKADYTEPYIYSLKSNKKLVYLIEAEFVAHQVINVGQPIEVSLSGNKVD